MKLHGDPWAPDFQALRARPGSWHRDAGAASPGDV